MVTPEHPSAAGETDKTKLTAFDRLSEIYNDLEPIIGDENDYHFQNLQDGSRIVVGNELQFGVRRNNNALACTVADTRGRETRFVVYQDGTLSKLSLPAQRIMLGNLTLTNVANNGDRISLGTHTVDTQPPDMLIDWVTEILAERRYVGPPITIESY